ncbi:hypothetical protein AB0F81_25670 [Actinoplanes sp. NPDC024001]|uniref:hypothetical protein n=1 Tax=Actinoplanes sp. NPDC024001 TaxID=3154598 RepID=UPI0033F9CAE0
MNPEQHATRAAELVAEAEQLYADLRHDVEAGGKVDQAVWGFLDTTVRLGQLHATLALRQPAAANEATE